LVQLILAQVLELVWRLELRSVQVQALRLVWALGLLFVMALQFVWVELLAFQVAALWLVPGRGQPAVGLAGWHLQYRQMRAQ
jgi:hypothetical protein